MNIHAKPRRAKRQRKQSSLGEVMAVLAQMSIIMMGIVILTASLAFAQALVAPLALSMVIGLMLSPIAERVERTGLPPSMSAMLAVLAFVFIIGVVAIILAVPLSDWAGRLPVIWLKLKAIAADWKDAVASFSSLQESLQSALGGAEQVRVTVDDGSPIADAAFLAPTIIMQCLVFLASMYFFVASRDSIRASVLSLCFDRRLRWRVAHIFRDVGAMVSTYLLSITVVNIALGIAVTAAMWMLGVPSPLLWGAMAALLNYVVYIGPVVMAVTLVGVGIATGHGTTEYLTPVFVYLILNLIEAQFVTPHVVGRSLTLNPFLVFLALVFWIWVWGPIGGFVAVPLLLILTAIMRHVLPANHRNYVRASNESKVAEEQAV
jgi:predicted PurR-regulated permease PerM